MHPVVRIATFLVFAALVASGEPFLVLALAGAVLLVHVCFGWRYAPRLGRTLWRLKWLFLSLLVMYFWWTPGQPLFPAWPHVSPTVEGLREGALRLGALAALVAGVVVVLETTERAALVDALRWYLQPLRRWGFPVERAALRVALILDLVPGMRRTVGAATPGRGRGSLRAWVDTVDGLFADTVARAEAAAPVTVTLGPLRSPPLRHWLYPLTLALPALLVLA